MTNYTEKDFAKCVFNPFSKKPLSGSDLSRILPKDLDEKDSVKEMVLRYIIAMYDQLSPLIRMEPDPQKRKNAAAIIAGIQDDKMIDGLMENSIPWVVFAINEYLRLYGANRIYAMLCSEEQRFWEYNYRLMKPVEGERDKEILASLEVKSKLGEELYKIHERLEKLYRNYYGEDTSLIEESRTKRLTPEFFANGTRQ